MLRVSRQLQGLGYNALPAIQAGPSRIPFRTANVDRYLAIHSFFTRQASIGTKSRQAFPRQPHPSSRFNSSSNHGRSIPEFTAADAPRKTSGSSPSHDHAPRPSYRLDHCQDYTPFIRRLIHQSSSLETNSANRPTKDELLAAAGSWWDRLKIRLKWFTIRGWRRFNADDISAFASWFLVGNSR